MDQDEKWPDMTELGFQAQARANSLQETAETIPQDGPLFTATWAVFRATTMLALKAGQLASAENVLMNARRDLLCECIADVFIEGSRDGKHVVAEHVYPGDSDPGEWAPSAMFVIHVEAFFPSGDPYLEEWNGISDRMTKAGCPCFVEWINPAVAAVYPL